MEVDRPRAEEELRCDLAVRETLATKRASHRGVTDVPGLYFLGLPWQHTRGSALLGWVEDDARYVAAEIAERASAVHARAAA